MQFDTLTALLDQRAQETGRIGLIEGDNDIRHLSFGELRQQALRVLAALRARQLADSRFIILFTDDSERFLKFFWAALYGGITPVPLAAGVTTGALTKLAKIWQLLGQVPVVTTPELKESILRYASEQGIEGIEAHCHGGILPREQAARPARIEAADRAFIQFSSGSTGDPKGVVLTHANILANIRLASMASAYRKEEVALSWMPLSHDLGLIGFHLTMLGNGFDHYIMPTSLFARRPRLWLQAAADVRATVLCSPNFGYRHTLRAIESKGLPDVDLSRVRLIYNGAEPIAASLARRFLDTLAGTGLEPGAMCCVYGLAEASLVVTLAEPGAGMHTIWVARHSLAPGDRVIPAEAGEPEAVELVLLGGAIPDTEVRIADDQGKSLPAGSVGRVLIRGPSVTSGYYDNPSANARALLDDGWVDTRDLGFSHQSQLVITGRVDDLVFVNGQNFYPQDIEALLIEAIELLDLNKLVAAPVRLHGDESDRLAIFVLHRGKLEDLAPVAREITATLSRELGIVATVIPVPQIPKTSSGKLQRKQLTLAANQGEFDSRLRELGALLNAPAADSGHADGIAEQLLAVCRGVIGDREIGADDNLFEIELSSLDLAQIFEEIEQRFSVDLEITDLFDYPTVNDLARFLAEDANDG
ncbi:MAG: AMP-binding protein [Chromatocurvus sp.]